MKRRKSIHWIFHWGKVDGFCPSCKGLRCFFCAQMRMLDKMIPKKANEITLATKFGSYSVINNYLNRKTSLPPTKVALTCPRSVRPFHGQFLDLLLKASASTVHFWSGLNIQTSPEAPTDKVPAGKSQISAPLCVIKAMTSFSDNSLLW